MTSTSTVGLPRESRISRARMSRIALPVVIGGRDRAGMAPERPSRGGDRLAVTQDGDARQVLALEELQRRPAAGRDVGHPACQAELIHTGRRIAAPEPDGRAGP